MTKAKPSLASLRATSVQVVDDFILQRPRKLIGRPRQEVRGFLLSQLLERCEGFSTREYRSALNVALSLRSHALKWRRLKREAASSRDAGHELDP